MTWWSLRVICFALVFLIPAYGESNKTMLVTTTNTSSTTTTVQTTTTTIPPTTTTIPSTTTTTEKQFSSQAVSQKNQGGIWDKMAQCESNGNWALDSFHDGGLQFHPDTWTAYVAAGKPYALPGYPVYAYQATREQQIVVAERVRDGVEGSSKPYLNSQGYGAWPNCRRAAGV